ncbi:MAG TPA: TonB-dependent receptor plug domain-containing protein, partial [Parasegetibacter sp.]
MSLKLDNVYLNAVFKELRKQTGMLFLFDNAEARKAGKVSIDVENEELKSTLDRLLSTTGFKYSIFDKTIVLRPKAESPVIAEEIKPPFDLRGRVISEKGEPLAGAAIVIKGKPNRGVMTLDNGTFEIKGVNENDVLEITMTGYQKQEIRVKEGMNDITIRMIIQVSTLNEVVVNGYQTIRKKLYTGSATTLKSDDVKMPGINDVSRMLEGRAAGVSIQNVSGTFGAAPKVRVRGATSITGENKPLWVVDGIILEDMVNISNDQLSSGDPATLLGSAVAGLNPEDIATFEILKDASATALYGGRAMNGVIVITTKKGK